MLTSSTIGDVMSHLKGLRAKHNLMTRDPNIVRYREALIESYGKMARDVFSALSKWHKNFSSIHQDELYPASLAVAEVDVFEKMSKSVKKLVTEADELSLAYAKFELFGETKITQAMQDKASLIQMLVYKQKKEARKYKKTIQPGPDYYFTQDFYEFPPLVMQALKKYYDDTKDLDVVLDRGEFKKATDLHVTHLTNKKRTNRWVKQNLNRYMIAREDYILKRIMI